MSNIKFSRGSEWRKWDLHVHSPYTFMNSYSATDKEFIDKIKCEGISVIGLTNYFKFSDNEFSLKDKLEKENITVFFNLEIRLSHQNSGDECLDYHIIFSNTLSKETIQKFIQNLKVTIKTNSKRCNDLNENDDFKYGVIDFDHLIQTLDDETIGLKNQFLIGFLSRGKGNGRSSSIYEKLTKKSDIMIHSTDNVRNIQDDRVFWLSYNKPLLQNSDAHSINAIGSKFTWIKADPTFEGLKQIIYEPEERVKIEANKPEEKTGYQAIDKIIIRECADIEDSEILFNQNLNTIIGGRSTGKSILLGAIAKKLKLEHNPDFEADYSYYIDTISDKISIFWKDGTENNDREVEYFKQSYIYDLSKNREKLNNIIEKILIQKGKGKEIEEYKRFIFDNSKAISSGISDLFQILSDITKIKQILLDLGDKSGVEKEIEKLNEELKRNSTTQITDGEKTEYEDLKKKLEDLTNKKNSNNNDFKNIEKLKFNSFLKENIDYELISISDELVNEDIKTFYIKIKEEFNEKWNLKIDEINKKINSDNLKVEKLIKEISENSIYIKVSKAFTESVQLQEIEKKLKNQKEKLTQIEIIIKKSESLDKQKKDLIVKIKEFYNKYKFEADIIISKLSDKVDGLEIKSIIRINENKYKENLEISLNNIKSENKSALISTSDKIFEIFDSLIEGNLSFKGLFNSESLSKKIMTENLYEIHYELIYEGDTFGKMSDGKKAFVVLKLLLDFSDKECPILIDQPEDDLDNRSICKELVEYLKRKKKQRQIIVATHNPNVVVTADAEEIIVSNQNGNGTLNDNGKKFQYISGSLENTIFLDKEILKTSILNSQGIKEHVCDIVEGGEIAFDLRKRKYKGNI